MCLCIYFISFTFKTKFYLFRNTTKFPTRIAASEVPRAGKANFNKGPSTYSLFPRLTSTGRLGQKPPLKASSTNDKTN